jgi:hypothetical protein
VGPPVRPGCSSLQSKNRCNLAQPPATHLLGWWDIISTPLQ